jgi:putative oxidoreductase
MKRIISTDSSNWTALIARLALGITIFPHGAQKLLGWFGGGGFNGTMGFFTESLGIPAIIALLVILIEFFGSLFLIFGFLTRVSALGFIGLFAGITYNHLPNGFFMNWGGTQNGEGIEFFILLFGLGIISLLKGGGKASIDSVLVKTFN